MSLIISDGPGHVSTIVQASLHTLHTALDHYTTGASFK